MKALPNLLTRGRLKTRHIILLVHLDEQRSVLRAAKTANMTQPGASKLLGELEDSLGVKLFTRHSRGIEPTWYGEIMTRHARIALAEMDRAQDEISALKSGLTGRTVIGAVVNPGMNLVPKAVAALKRRQPRILVRIDIDNSDALVRRLLKGELDIVVARLLGSHATSDLKFEPLAVETHGVIARAGHPLAQKRHLDLRDLADQSWILPPSGSLLRDRLDSMFVLRGLGALRDVVETASIQVIIGLLQNTDMISALQVESVDPYCKANLLAVLPLTLGVLMEPFGIITRRGHPMSPGTEALLASLREAATQMHANTSKAAPIGTRAASTKPRRSAHGKAKAVDAG